MKKSIMDLLLSLSIVGANEYGQFYVNDPKVSDCLMNMYFCMLYNEANKQKKEECFKRFEQSFDDLDEEQKEIVRKDFIEIIDAQDKNNEKVKVKKKGMNNNE